MHPCPNCQQPTADPYYCSETCAEAVRRRLSAMFSAHPSARRRPRQPAPFLVKDCDSLPRLLEQIRDHWAELTCVLPAAQYQRLNVLREEFEVYACGFTAAPHLAGYARLSRALCAWVKEANDPTTAHPLTSGYRFEFYEALSGMAAGTYVGAHYVPYLGFFGNLPMEMSLSAADKRRLTLGLRGTSVLFRLPTDLELPSGERWRTLSGALCLGVDLRFLGSDTSREEHLLDDPATQDSRPLRQPMRIGLPSKTRPGTFSMEYDTWQIPVDWIVELSAPWSARYWGPVDWSSLETARAALTAPLPASRFADQIAAGERV